MSQKKLKELYDETSKHSNYQILASSVAKLLDTNELAINSRWEKERLTFMKQHVDFNEKAIVDIGGNTGFFTFELIDSGASKATYIEGNKEHAEFVQEAASSLGLSDQVDIRNEYFDFGKDAVAQREPVDAMLLLNVLHHVGDDYGDQKLTTQGALEQIAESLRNIASYTQYVVFQLGFCWQGKADRALFANGTKSELIDFVKQAVDGVWAVDAIGIPERNGSEIRYGSPTPDNIQRDDSLGEFLNRPLFILSRSKN